MRKGIGFYKSRCSHHLLSNLIIYFVNVLDDFRFYEIEISGRKCSNTVFIGFNDSCGFRGCKQDNLIFEVVYVLNDTTFFECFSKVRQNLIVKISQTKLERHLDFLNTT